MNKLQRYEPNPYVLNLSVPFKVGDIVTIDCTPFVPKKRVIIIENWDHVDWCSLQTIYQNKDGYWETTNVKDARVFPNYCYTNISPLYRIEKYTGKLSEDEMILLEVQDYLSGDAKKGKALWTEIHSGKEKSVTTERLREIINR